MMRAVADLGRRYGQRAFVSLEPVMGCGTGGCYSCVIPICQDERTHFVRACLDGPVFDAKTVAWHALKGH
jgi:NAD(P)H-flavin reductase